MKFRKVLARILIAKIQLIKDSNRFDQPVLLPEKKTIKDYSQQ